MPFINIITHKAEAGKEVVLISQLQFQLGDL